MAEGGALRAQSFVRKITLPAAGIVILGLALFALLSADRLEAWGARLAESFRGGLSLPLTLVVVFFAGILTSLTPCVYPVVPLAVTYLGARGATSRLRAFSLAAAYVLGMVLCYTALGAAAGLTGTTFGAATQKWWVYAAVATIVLLFGLSMLGLFTLSLPPALQRLVGRRSGPGYKGAILMGATSGLVTAPCTAPVLGTLILPMISRQSVALGSLLLAVFGLGMGMLFLVVGTYSGVLSSLPRSGRWMNAVKVSLGVAILLVAGYFYVQAYRLLPFRAGSAPPVQTGQTGAAPGPAPRLASTSFSFPAQTSEGDERPPAPDFDLVDVKGARHHRELYRGKTLHLIFFAVWCPTCVDQMRRIEVAYARLRGRGYAAVAVGVKDREDDEVLRAFAQKRTLEFPVAWDRAGEAAKAFAVDSVPAHVIIGPDGRILYQGRDVPEGFERDGGGLLPP